LDTELLARAVSELISQFPALSERYDAKSGVVLPSPDPVKIKTRNYIEPKRRDVLRGKAPLFTASLTKSEDGTCLGMAISHLLTDAAGYHMIMRHLGDIYSALISGHAAPKYPFATQLEAFQFGTEQSKSETLNQLKKRGLPKPIPMG